MNKERYASGFVDVRNIYPHVKFHEYTNPPYKPPTFFERNEHLIIGLGVIVAFIVGAIGLVNLLAPSEQQLAEWHKPQIIQEFDGCKVYRFYDNNFHYITRCGSKVTTQKNWDEYCGKACVQHRKEELRTENNQ